jgi:serine/threonine protein kinase
MINNKYNLIEKIGKGNFGSIYKGENIRTNELVAIKVEPIQSNTNLLKNEAKIYQYLLNSPNVPQVKWFGKDNDNYYMVINLLTLIILKKIIY